MIKECTNRYLVCGLNEASLADFRHMDVEQVFLDGEFMKAVAGRLTGVPIQEMEQISIVKVGNQSKLVVETTRRGQGNFEMDVCSDFAEDFIEGYGVKRLSKTKYICPCEKFGSTLQVDFYKNRNLTVAQMEYDPYEYDPKFIDRFARFMIKSLNEHTIVTDVTNDINYADSALASNCESADEK